MPEYNETMKFRTNIQEVITFPFNDFKSGTSEDKFNGGMKPWFKYTVENRGETKTLFPTEALHNRLQSLAPLQGKTLEITLEEDGTRKRWKIMQGGVEVPQTTSYTTSSRNTPTGGKMEATKPTTKPLDVEKLREWVKETNDRIKSLENRVKELEAKAFPPEKDEEGNEVLSRDGEHATKEDLDKIPY